MKKAKYYHQQSLQKEVEFTILDHLTFQLLFRKLMQSMKRLITVLQFCFHRLTFGAFNRYKLSWFQLAVLAFAVFIFFKKDFHFQVRMKSPVANSTATPASSDAEHMSLASSIPWLNSSSSASKETGIPLPQLNATKVESYIKRFAKVAIMEQEKFGIPASIKMAQGLLESQAGQSSLAKQTNNHFGKVFSSESFGTAWESWRAHSQMMTHENSQYRSLLRYGKDYKSWAAGLESMHYSDYANYGKAIVELIEEYEMFRLDNMKL